jgi:CRISPR-associated protein Cmr6
MIESTRRNNLSDICLPLAIIPSNGPNAGLWLDKFIHNQKSDANLTSRVIKTKRITPKARLVEDVAAIPVPPVYAKFFERWESGMKTLCPKEGLGIAKVQGRMAVGLGDESVLETSVKLHRTYGVPYIPGSALKGLVASYARNRIGGEWAKDKPAYQIVFGKTEEAGYLTFHDALYVPGSANGKPLRADVITVHHPDYYGGIKKGGELSPPADWDDPNPVPFLSVTGDYLVALSAVPDCELWITQTWKILELALREEGIGAKTSSGYGRMKLSQI